VNKILIVGSKGYIGNILSKKIIEKNKKIELFLDKKKDIRKKKNWQKFPKSNCLIFLAGISSIKKSLDDPFNCFDVNLNGIINALNYCKIHNSRLIFLSSAACKFSEKKTNPYQKSKNLSENICQFYSSFYNIDISILRLFNVYGNNQTFDFLIPSLINQVENKKNITVKNLESKRDYIFVDDVCDAIIACINYKNKFNIFEIGTGKNYSVQQVIDIIQKIKKTNLPVKNLNSDIFNSVKFSKANNKSAKKILKWQPKYTLEQGLRKFIK